jgi:hypothetical protein
MNFEDTLNPLISQLKVLKKDDNAAPFFDHMSGGFIWSDEKLRRLNVKEMGCMRAVFRYRTSLIVQEADLRFESLWHELRKRFPDWIGFDPARCSPRDDLISQYREIKMKPII